MKTTTCILQINLPLQKRSGSHIPCRPLAKMTQQPSLWRCPSSVGNTACLMLTCSGHRHHGDRGLGVKMTKACCHPWRSWACWEQPTCWQNRALFSQVGWRQAAIRILFIPCPLLLPLTQHSLADLRVLLVGSSDPSTEFWAATHSSGDGRRDKAALAPSAQCTPLFSPSLESILTPQSHKIPVRQHLQN